MTKLGFVCSLSFIQQKCQLLTPHKFGSRVPLLLTEIEISRSAIMKNDKIGFCAFPVTHTAKVPITDPPHNFGSRVPSLLTEIEISRSAIMKNDKIGFCAFPIARTAKVSITDPPQVWVKGSIVVNGNRNFPLGHFEK